MKCKKAIRQLPAYLDRELADEERKELEQHIEVCLFCSTQLSALRTTSSVLDSWIAVPLRRSRVPDVVGQIRAEKEGAFHPHASLRNCGLTVLTLRAAAALVFLAGSVIFSAHFTGDRGPEKVSARIAGEPQPGSNLVALDEDVRQNYIKPSEFWLAVRGMEDRSGPASGSSWNDLLRRVTSDGISGSPIRLPVVDHVYYTGEGMPVESIIPVGGP
jgi:hypothetical protein